MKVIERFVILKFTIILVFFVALCFISSLLDNSLDPPQRSGNAGGSLGMFATAEWWKVEIWKSKNSNAPRACRRRGHSRRGSREDGGGDSIFQAPTPVSGRCPINRVVAGRVTTDDGREKRIDEECGEPRALAIILHRDNNAKTKSFLQYKGNFSKNFNYTDIVNVIYNCKCNRIN